ncbi:sodium-coupled monocarboxylate transporter 1-like [Haemaphysalis longicornis]
MLVVSAAIGVYYAFWGTRKETTDEFLMGGRTLRVLPVALSILASFMSAITLLGTAAEIYVYGTQYMLIVVSYCLVIPASAYLYMPVFHGLQITSVYEYLEMRFNHVVRCMGSMTFTLQMLVYMSIVLYAPALALSQVTGIGTWTSVLSLGLVCTFYTSIGGMRAVVWTDVFQIVLMFGAMLMVVILGTIDLSGGLKAVFDKAHDGDRLELFNVHLSPTVRHTMFGTTIGTFFTWMTIYAVSQAMVQRYLSIPTVAGARKAIWLNLPGLSFLMIICAMSGLVMYARYHDCDPIMTKKVSASDQLLPLYVMDVLGNIRGLPGLFVSGIFSAALSTVSSGMNSLAAVALEDVVRRYIARDMSDRSATALTRILAVAFGCIAIALVYGAQMMGNVLQAALAIFGIVGGPLLGVFTLGIFFPFASSLGAGVGIVTSLVTTIWIGGGAFYYKPAVDMPKRSVNGCLAEYFNITHQDPTNATFFRVPIPDVDNKGIPFFYRISYVWYSMIACSLVVIVGIIVSLLTGATRPSKVNPRLVHPAYNRIARKLLPPNMHDTCLVKSESDYNLDRMVGLGQTKGTAFGVNPAFVESTENLPDRVTASGVTASDVSLGGGAQPASAPPAEGGSEPRKPSQVSVDRSKTSSRSSRPDGEGGKPEPSESSTATAVAASPAGAEEAGTSVERREPENLDGAMPKDAPPTTQTSGTPTSTAPLPSTADSAVRSPTRGDGGKDDGASAKAAESEGPSGNDAVAKGQADGGPLTGEQPK